MEGLMQGAQLTTTSIIAFAARAHASREIVSRNVEGGITRMTYADIYERAGRAASVIRHLGISEGDRVATLAWNTHKHLELLFAIPGLGAIVHTVNPRLSDDQLEFVINDGGARILLIDGDLAPLVRRISPALSSVEKHVLLSDPAEGLARYEGWLRYDDLLAQEEELFDWPLIDERAGACLCYTSGTTRGPKGVLYSHRSIVLHSMGASLNGAFAYRADDCVLPAASFYHSTGWGIPYIAPLNGVKLVLPAQRLDALSLHELFEAEKVTLSCGVPTIWTNYLALLAEENARPSSLKRLIIGGSALPISMAELLWEKYGVEVTHAWGMTELSPTGVVSCDSPALGDLSDEQRRHILWSKQGRLQYGVELRLINDKGEVSWDGTTPGHLQARGLWVARRYFKHDADATEEGGWLDTGDIAVIDKFGFLKLTDRSKDLIKSGGEWISSIELETTAEACDGVHLAAVIGVPHPKWDERPLLIVEREAASQISGCEILAYVAQRVAKWSCPDDVVFIEEMPLTSTGKLDKKALRGQFRDHILARSDIDQ